MLKNNIQNCSFRSFKPLAKADLIILDPPHDIFFDDLFFHIDRVKKQGCIVFIIDSDAHLMDYREQNKDRFSFFLVHDFIWHIGGGNKPLHQFDLIACFDYNASKFQNLHDGFSNLIRIKSERMKGTKNLLHRHQKPVKLYDELIKHFSQEGDMVLDFFVGSGAIASSCYKLNRRFEGCELDTETFNNIKPCVAEKEGRQGKII